MTDLTPIIDINGNERRLGSLEPPPNFVSAFPLFESVVVPWPDDDVRKAIADPNRVQGRKLFGDRWILDQRSHGSCNGYMGAGLMQKARFAGGLTDGLLLSGAYVYSKVNGHRDSGSALEDSLQTIMQDGVCPADLVTWDMIYPERQPKNADEEAAKHKGFKCFALNQNKGEAHFRACLNTALAAGYYVGVAVHVSSNFQRLNSQGIAGVDNGGGNHAVHVDDLKWENGEYLYDMANSWNLSYGTKGRAWLRWASFAQTWNRHVFYCVPPTTVENP